METKHWKTLAIVLGIGLFVAVVCAVPTAYYGGTQGVIQINLDGRDAISEALPSPTATNEVVGTNGANMSDASRPLPTQTRPPTNTPLPTVTPFPTYTPQPTTDWRNACSKLVPGKSSDGRVLAVCTVTSGLTSAVGNERVSLVDVQGNVEPMVPDFARDEEWWDLRQEANPFWLGESIGFTVEQYGETFLYLLNPDGELQKVRTMVAGVTHAVASPDAQNVAFLVGPLFHQQVFVLNMETDELKQVSTGDSNYYGPLQWLDNQTLLVLFFMHPPAEAIKAIDIQSGEEAIVARGAMSLTASAEVWGFADTEKYFLMLGEEKVAVDRVSTSYVGAISPDGQRFAYVSIADDLVIYNVQTGQSVVLRKSNASQIVWVDSQNLAVLEYEEGKHIVHFVRGR